MLRCEGRCREVFLGMGMSKERCMRSGEVCGGVYGVSGEVCWREGEGCGERNGGGVGKCVRVWGLNTLPPTLPHISFLTLPPPHPNTLSYTSSHTSFHISPSFPHTPTHFPTPIPTSTSPSQSGVKLPWDEVSVAKLLGTIVTASGVATSRRGGFGGCNPPLHESKDVVHI